MYKLWFGRLNPVQVIHSIDIESSIPWDFRRQPDIEKFRDLDVLNRLAPSNPTEEMLQYIAAHPFKFVLRDGIITFSDKYGSGLYTSISITVPSQSVEQYLFYANGMVNLNSKNLSEENYLLRFTKPLYKQIRSLMGHVVEASFCFATKSNPLTEYHRIVSEPQRKQFPMRMLQSIERIRNKLVYFKA